MFAHRPASPRPRRIERSGHDLDRERRSRLVAVLRRRGELRRPRESLAGDRCPPQRWTHDRTANSLWGNGWHTRADDFHRPVQDREHRSLSRHACPSRRSERRSSGPSCWKRKKEFDVALIQSGDLLASAHDGNSQSSKSELLQAIGALQHRSVEINLTVASATLFRRNTFDALTKHLVGGGGLPHATPSSSRPPPSGRRLSAPAQIATQQHRSPRRERQL